MGGPYLRPTESWKTGLVRLLLPACSLWCALASGLAAQEGLGQDVLRQDPPPGVIRLPHPLPPPGAEAPGYGAQVQRTMTALATSTASVRHHVRIMVYGQSISEGKWWLQVRQDLIARYPQADIEMINRARGGHASNMLVRDAETDLYPWYPDLVLFHVYGAHTCYEQLIHRLRSRTTAEVLITNDHLGADDRLQDGSYPDLGWTKFMAQWIPRVASRYGCELVPLREGWKRYVIDNQLAPRELLIDGIHLNPHGNALYAGLIERQLVYRPQLPAEHLAGSITTRAVGSDLTWQDGSLHCAFDGNRILAIAGPGDQELEAEVLVDGQPPSACIACHAFTSAQGPLSFRCCSSQRACLDEDWTLRITQVDREANQVAFTLSGSRTGPDGAGSTAARFVSRSGRVVIENLVEKPYMASESDFVWDRGDPNLVVGATTTFSSYGLGVDRYRAPPAGDPARERTVVLAQGLANGHHLLVLRALGTGTVPLQALRIYRPAVPADAPMLYASPGTPALR